MYRTPPMPAETLEHLRRTAAKILGVGGIGCAVSTLVERPIQNLGLHRHFNDLLASSNTEAGNAGKQHEMCDASVVCRPKSKCGLDFINLFSSIAKGTLEQYIITATNYVRKWAEAKAVCKVDASSTTLFLYENIIT